MLREVCVDCGSVLTGHGKPERCRSCAGRAKYIAKHGQPPLKLVERCAVCDKQFVDYASNRKKGEVHTCSPECRSAWTRAHNSISRGGDGLVRTKAERDALHYRENADRIRATARRYYERNKVRLAESRRELKRQVVEGYGGACVCCGETTFEFLTIDHIENDGAEHRRRTGKRVYQELIKLGCPKDKYQLLCFNCNASIGFYGFCPHRPHEQRRQLTSQSHGRKKRIA